MILECLIWGLGQVEGTEACMPYALTLPGFNPLSPKSDRPLISPYSIPVGSHIKVMRTKEMITN